jgi:propanediol dehydratase small subunit
MAKVFHNGMGDLGARAENVPWMIALDGTERTDVSMALHAWAEQLRKDAKVIRDAGGPETLAKEFESRANACDEIDFLVEL